MRYKGFWRETISKALESLGGEADTVNVYRWVKTHVDLTHRELSESRHQSRPHFHNTIRGVANDMARDGILIHIRRGRYRLR